MINRRTLRSCGSALRNASLFAMLAACSSSQDSGGSVRAEAVSLHGSPGGTGHEGHIDPDRAARTEVPDIDLTQKASGRIYNGDIPYPGDGFTALETMTVKICFGGSGCTEKGDGMCSGTLLSNHWVLTAAHCLTWQNGAVPTNYPVTVSTSTGGVASSVDYAFRNPDAPGLNSPDFPNSARVDTALLHTVDPISPSGYAPPSLSTRDPQVGDVLKCLGYGVESPGTGTYGIGAGYLCTASLSVLQTYETSAYGDDYRRFEVGRNSQNQIFGDGDSGGPCFYQGQLIGVDSDGSGHLPGPWSGLVKSTAFSNWATHPGWSAAYAMAGNWPSAGNRNIAAVARTSINLDAYTINTDGRVWNAGGWTPSGQTSPFVMPTNQAAGSWTPGGGIAAVARTSTMTDTYTIGGDGRVWEASGWNNGTWISPSPMPNQNANSWTVGGGIAAVSRTPTMTDIYTIGGDGRVWMAAGWHQDTGFGVPTLMGNQAVGSWVNGGGIAAIARDENTTETFTVGHDGRVWMAAGWNASAGWVAPYPLNMPVNTFAQGAPLSAVSRSPGVVDIYIVGQDGAVWNAGFSVCNGACNGANWAAPFQINKTASWQNPSGVAAAARGPGNVDVYTIGGDGPTYDAASWVGFDLPAWSSVYRPGGDVNTVSNTFPAGTHFSAVSRRDGTQDIFAKGADGHIYWSSYSENTNQWTAFTQVGQNWNAFPDGHEVTAVSRATGHIDLFAIGGDGQVWNTWWDDTSSTWSNGWYAIPGATFPGTKVAALAHSNPEGLDIFSISSAGYLSSAFYRVGGSWSGWFSLGSTVFPTSANVSAVHRTATRMDVVVRQGVVAGGSIDGRAQWTWWDDASSSSWASIQPVGTLSNTFDSGTDFALTSRQSGQVDMFAVGSAPDRRIWTTYLSPGSNAWVPWYPLGDATQNTFPAGTRLSALGRSGSRMDIFGMGNNGMLSSATWDGRTNQWNFFQIGNSQNIFPAGNPVTALTRSYHVPGTSTYLQNQQMDIFAVGYPTDPTNNPNGGVYSTYWHP